MAIGSETNISLMICLCGKRQSDDEWNFDLSMSGYLSEGYSFLRSLLKQMLKNEGIEDIQIAHT